MPHSHKRLRRRTCQKSPFLALPPEIRNLIYQVALIKPSPIDLCPPQYASTSDQVDTDPAMKSRYDKFLIKYPQPTVHEPTGLRLRTTKVAFRLQRDLLYVRKQLATGLLGTCSQIYNEAAEYFWAGNHWRFTDDNGWVVFWRFLMAIGPVARQWIRSIDVLAPFAWEHPYRFPMEHEWCIKNHPKLRLTKLWLHRENHYDDDHFGPVFDMIAREKSLRNLNFIVSKKRTFNLGSHDPELWEVPIGFLPKISVIVEAEGSLYTKTETHQEGWDLIALQGSFIYDCVDGGDRAERQIMQDESTRWESDVDLLTGVRQLFDEDDISVNANSGRVHVREKGKRLDRVLRGFGPSKIVVDKLCWDGCQNCLFERQKSKFFKKNVCHFRYRSLVV